MTAASILVGILRWSVIAALVLAALIIVLRIAYPLPSLDNRPRSLALAPGGVETLIGAAVIPRTELHAGLTGVHLLVDGREAFAARMLLARTAQRSLDVQYYIWHNDLSGSLLLSELSAAADRGVRVRLLLDDNGIAGLDTVLAALHDHPGIEVRLFNPFIIRSPKWLGYATDFFRLNRRMHNKSFTVDGRATIVGGRNIGDEYFGAATSGLFYDLDVLAVGEVVPRISTDFDRYWASGSSYPADRILPSPSADSRANLVRTLAKAAARPAARDYLDAVEQSPFVNDVMAARLAFEWTNVRLLSDPPSKGLGQADPDQLLTTKLARAIGEPRHELSLISGYFVPTKAGTAAFVDMARRGVKVKVLTNSYAATDVGLVHAGYAHRRRPLLEAGIALFEVPVPPSVNGEGRSSAKPRKKLGLGSGSGTGNVIRSSASTLHAKTFAVDRERLFIGSFNFDPRSFDLNSEMGLVMESPTLAGAVQDAFDHEIADQAYRLGIDRQGKLNWSDPRGERPVLLDQEPGTTTFTRWGISVLSRLPVEWLL